MGKDDDAWCVCVCLDRSRFRICTCYDEPDDFFNNALIGAATAAANVASALSSLLLLPLLLLRLLLFQPVFSFPPAARGEPRVDGGRAL